MTNALQIFNYEGSTVRTIEKDGKSWFAAKDVCEILGLDNVTKAIKPLDDDEKMTLTNIQGQTGRGGAQFLNYITESGVYALVFRSRKPGAKAFSRWVRSVVLPAIRKNGMYATPQSAADLMNDPRKLAELLLDYADAKDQAAALQSQIEENAPKVELADAITASESSIHVGVFAKILNQAGIKIGPKQLFRDLRKMGFLMKRGKYYIPTQRSVNLGIMQLDERTYKDAYGRPLISQKAMITGKGQGYFLNYYKNRKAAENVTDCICVSELFLPF